MKISQVCNGSLVIQANVKKLGDMQAALSVASRMEEESGGLFVVTSSCDVEQWVQLCGSWEKEQQQYFIAAYREAKKYVMLDKSTIDSSVS